jgi:hypothetical protein
MTMQNDTIQLSARTLTQIWKAQTRDIRPARPEYRTRVARICADGWGSSDDIEMLICDATGLLLLGHCHGEIMAALGIHPTYIHFRPKRGDRESYGSERYRAAEIGRLLIFLEAAGLSIDPKPLVDALLPALSKLPILTESELRIWWRADGPNFGGLTLEAPGAQADHDLVPVAVAGCLVSAWGCGDTVTGISIRPDLATAQ